MTYMTLNVFFSVLLWVNGSAIFLMSLDSSLRFSDYLGILLLPDCFSTESQQQVYKHLNVTSSLLPRNYGLKGLLGRCREQVVQNK